MEYSDVEVNFPLSVMSVSNWCANHFITVHGNRFGVFLDNLTC